MVSDIMNRSDFPFSIRCHWHGLKTNKDESIHRKIKENMTRKKCHEVNVLFRGGLIWYFFSVERNFPETFCFNLIDYIRCSDKINFNNVIRNIYY